MVEWICRRGTSSEVCENSLQALTGGRLFSFFVQSSLHKPNAFDNDFRFCRTYSVGALLEKCPLILGQTDFKEFGFLVTGRASCSWGHNHHLTFARTYILHYVRTKVKHFP